MKKSKNSRDNPFPLSYIVAMNLAAATHYFWFFGYPKPLVMADVARRIAAGDERIVGVMIESHLVSGRQDLVAGRPLNYGQSITDGCIDWDTSVTVLENLAAAVAQRRCTRPTVRRARGRRF